MHQVERAIFDIRRGLPVVLQSGDELLLVQALEGNHSVRTLSALAKASPALVMTRHRLAALGVTLDAEAGRLPLHDELSEAELSMLSVAPLAEHSPAKPCLNGLEAANAAEQAALTLMRRALLVPAALCARIDRQQHDAIVEQIHQGSLLRVSLEAAQACLHGAPGMLKRVSEARIPLAEAAEARFVLFREPDGMREHVAVIIGELDIERAVPLRLHSACLTGDLFGSLRCDCGEQLRKAVADIDAMGGGVLLYLAQEGRGIGLANKLRAYTLQDSGLDTLDADQVLGFGEDERQYSVAVDMLNALDISRVQLLTNNPTKISALTQGGIEVVSRQALYGSLTDHNHRYLSAKAERAGHLLDAILGESPR
ncbi:GTP cyclohydrolase II [Vreelandella rituensis]|uniref:GTP cyclohydrolase-2 n=1 Tax=Vreelandella rituensis TaxID=2282306 RepID=A0A368U729_9GAMM|nr:GTP cyclohydrolase II [Halomonas rituensis]RCV92979.1 GTP cyclohydrolase II [Halomonas rituensis]